MLGKQSVDKDFYGAAETVKRLTEQEGLFPSVNEDGEERYRVQQGLKAACLAREDAAAALVVQYAVLRRLHELRVIGIVCIALLLYIAAQLT